MKNGEPIRLNFPRLKDLIAQGLLLNNECTFFCPDFAIIKRLRSSDSTFLLLGQPYRLVEPRIGLIYSGEAKVTLNLIDYHVKSGMLIFMSGNSIMQPIWFSPDFNVKAVAVTEDYMQVLFKGQVPTTFVGETFDRLLTVEAKDIAAISKLHEMLWNIVQQSDYSKEVAGCLIAGIYYYFDSINRHSSEIKKAEFSRDREVFRRYIQLVHKNSHKEHSLSFYADKMCLSQRYLGTLVKEASGVTAKEWIERSIISEAKVMLKHSDMMAYEISDELNFPNPSFFSKFFKRLTGMTPKEYQLS